MVVNNKKVVQWFYDRQGKLTYSMYGSRNGSDGTADCSGSITQAIRDAGGVAYDYLYSTVTLAGYLARNGYKRISVNQSWNAQLGDIVLMSWGRPELGMSASAGAGGHVGVMEDSINFISVDYWTGGQVGTAVSRHNWDSYYSIQKPSYIEVWRNTGEQINKPTEENKNRFKHELGKTVSFGGVFNSSDKASHANASDGYTPVSNLAKTSAEITKQQKTNGVSTYLLDDGFGWVNDGDITETHANDVLYMVNHGYVIWNHIRINVDDRSQYAGIWQVISNKLSGLTPSSTTSNVEWENNGVPMAGITWADGTPSNSTAGKTFIFDDDTMAIVDYDVPSNGIAVLVAGYKVWVDATFAKNA
ncbi:MAG: peptidoglycan hydrolase [Caudoviricetes sp.]|nr:MAG: peptidoglycan hydrolase [Caudoviricetes sp.]